MIYLWISLGSAIGGLLRYALGGWMGRVAGSAFPWGTLVINIAGCAFIGWFATFTGPEGRTVVTLRTRQFVMVGLCGGFTTFSAFSLDTLNLLRDGHPGRAAANVIASVVLCMAAVWAGHALAVSMNR